MSTRHKDFELLKASAIVLLVALLAAAAILFGASGCKALSQGKAGIATDLVTAQAPGEATGAGATLRGPANSGAPSRQVSERRTAYYRPGSDLAGVRYGKKPEPRSQKPEADSPMTPAPLPEMVATETGGLSGVAPMPAWTYERTETDLGAHQNVTGIMQAAAEMDKWSKARWIGAVLAFIGYSGLLWSHNNHETGYPLVWWKVAIIGLSVAIVDPSPWWLVALLLPAGLYLAQKFNLLRIPGLPT
jgi:hypothetical protein